MLTYYLQPGCPLLGDAALVYPGDDWAGMKGSLPCSSNQCFNGLRLTGSIPASNDGGAPDPPAVRSFSVGVVFLGLWLKQKPDCQATVSWPWHGALTGATPCPRATRNYSLKGREVHDPKAPKCTKYTKYPRTQILCELFLKPLARLLSSLFLLQSFPKWAVSNVSGFSFCLRVVAKIPSCRVNAISRRGNVQLGSSLGSSILLFPIRVAGVHAYTCSIRGKSLAPALSDSPV